MSAKRAVISVIGSGAVGATLAQRIIESDLADVILLDVVRNIALAKSLDLTDAGPILGHERKIIGTDSYDDIKGSDIVVITAGLPRKPGMTREDLISRNAEIVGAVSDNIRKHAPSSVVIVVTNPLDIMTYHAIKKTGFERSRVFGMAGVLDGSRMEALIAEELQISRSEVEACVMGSHGDTMVAVISNTRVSGRMVSECLDKNRLDNIVKRTRDRGAEIVNLLGTGSAYYSPSAAVLKMCSSILEDRREEMVASCLLQGEYGLKDICIGVPCILGAGGIKKIIELNLADDEISSLARSAKAIKSSIELL